MKINHIGYIVRNIKKSVDELEELGYKKTSRLVVDNKRNIKIQFLENNKYVVELIEPTYDNSNVDNILKKIGPTPYHICYETKNIYEKIEELEKKGYMILEKPTEAIAFKDKKVAFLYSKYIGVIEIVEI